MSVTLPAFHSIEDVAAAAGVSIPVALDCLADLARGPHHYVNGLGRWDDADVVALREYVQRRSAGQLVAAVNHCTPAGCCHGGQCNG